MKRILLVVLAIVLLLSACAPRTGIEIKEAWARAAREGENSAIYFVVQNNSSAADEIVGVASDVAGAVEMHESQMSGDVMQMHQLASVPLEPGAKVMFEPGGLHIMLVGLNRELKTGDEIELTLQFRNFEDMRIMVPVADSAADGENH